MQVPGQSLFINEPSPGADLMGKEQSMTIKTVKSVEDGTYTWHINKPHALRVMELLVRKGIPFSYEPYARITVAIDFETTLNDAVDWTRGELE
jgi:hypothetical protein